MLCSRTTLTWWCDADGPVSLQGRMVDLARILQLSTMIIYTIRLGLGISSLACLFLKMVISRRVVSFLFLSQDGELAITGMRANVFR